MFTEKVISDNSEVHTSFIIYQDVVPIRLLLLLLDLVVFSADIIVIHYTY